MDQTLTLLVDLIEQDKFSLFLSFLFVNALAIALSHYPIYTYYAANLNNSRNYTKWKKIFPFKNKFLDGIPLFVFTTNKESKYKPDNFAHYFRYLLGILIYFVWMHYTINSFLPKIYFEGFEYLILIEIIASAIPLILYIILKEKFTNYTKNKNELILKKNDYSLTIYNALSEENEAKLKALYKKFGLWYAITASITLIIILITIFKGNFSKLGFILLVTTNYLFMFNYVFFRLLRTKLGAISLALEDSNDIFTKGFIKLFSVFKSSKNYLLLFHFFFISAGILILYSTIASLYGSSICNGIPILLAYFYFYYFLIANMKKYFFVVKKMNLFDSKKYRNLFIIFTFLGTLILITNCAGGEVKTHELDPVNRPKFEVSEEVFVDKLIQKNDSILFFIASHGGGLKANVWTLNVVNKLQEITKYRLLDQTVSFSGASGGSLGLALYTGLYKSEGKDFDKIQSKIKIISEDNYVSPDLTLTLGLDTYRKVWPFNKINCIGDRPYYSMIRYQNSIENNDSSVNKLDTIPFRSYWNEAFNREKDGYFPSLIMNTSSTKGKRGIFWSVKQNQFDSIFPFSDNLADLNIKNEEKTLPFYQAVSTTNRFPFLSPAAKISGYGHFIDAGAIDNSGLLSNLDLYRYLLSKQVLKGKKVVFIEILNSKELYIGHVLKEIIDDKKNEINHLIFNENETDNITADIQTGFNLDKIPRYLGDFLNTTSKKDTTKLDFIQLYMPHKISMNDIENHVRGKLDSTQSNIIKEILKTKNNTIDKITEGSGPKRLCDSWNTYEPTLSRHLSSSSLSYIDSILKHTELTKRFSKINLLTEL